MIVWSGAHLLRIRPHDDHSWLFDLGSSEG